MKLGAFGPPHASGGVGEANRNRQLEEARRVGWPRLEAEDLVIHRFGSVEHRPTGDFHKLHRGELVDAVYSSATAYFMTEGGELRFLEPPAGFPSNRTELEQRQTEREQRRVNRKRQVTRR